MRRFHIIGGTTWAVTDPWQQIGTAKTVETFTDRTQAVKAMREHLGDPAWEPDDDPPRDPQRETEWALGQQLSSVEDACDTLILSSLEDTDD